VNQRTTLQRTRAWYSILLPPAKLRNPVTYVKDNGLHFVKWRQSSRNFDGGRAENSRRKTAFVLGVSLLLCFTIGCRNKTRNEAPSAVSGTVANSAAPTKGEAPNTERQLVVFAAASLRDAFTAISDDFKRTHPDAEVNFNFAGTQELRTQLEQGAAVDVFASADLRHMDELVRAGRAKAPVVFARNEPVIVVSREAAGTIKSLADLPNANRLVIGTPEVPIGRYTLQLLTRAAASLGADFPARVQAKVVSRELNVRQVLAKVRLGEADAGIAYRSDAVTAPGIKVVNIPADVNLVAEYPIAVVTDALHPGLARDWLVEVQSAVGRNVLSRAGFILPPE
jgi:molybdate transport system substrate-binding protein